MGWPAGKRHSEEAKKRIGEATRRRHEANGQREGAERLVCGRCGREVKGPQGLVVHQARWCSEKG